LCASLRWQLLAVAHRLADVFLICLADAADGRLLPQLEAI
jgi:hypothetical protein